MGGLILCYLGVRTFLASPAERAASSEAKGMGGAYVSTFLLTITNPMTILAFEPFLPAPVWQPRAAMHWRQCGW